jgi:hypothetical protein
MRCGTVRRGIIIAALGTSACVSACFAAGDDPGGAWRRAMKDSRALHAAPVPARAAARDALRVDWKIGPGTARVSDAKVEDQRYFAGVMVRERKERKIEEETLRKAEAAAQARRDRLHEEGEAGQTQRALQIRLNKKQRRIY